MTCSPLESGKELKVEEELYIGETLTNLSGIRKGIESYLHFELTGHNVKYPGIRKGIERK